MTSPGHIDFDNTTLADEEEGSPFDLLTDIFTPSVSGVYWLHFSIGLGLDAVNATLHGLPGSRTPNVIRNSTGSIDTSSRCDIVTLTAGIDQLKLISGGQSLHSNATGQHISFSGFNLDFAMDGVVAFSVGRSTSKETPVAERVAFDMVFIDTHSGWQMDAYIVPVAGIWVITLQCGDYPNHGGVGMTSLKLTGIYADVYHQWSGEGAEVSSITVIAQLRSNEEVHASTIDRGFLYSDANYQTAMAGFLYSPSALPAVVWSAALKRDRSGLADPLIFDNVQINEADGYDSDSGIFNAFYDGLYYISLSGKTQYDSYYPMKLELLLNGVVQADISVAFNTTNLRTRTRAVILRLSQDDQLWVRLPTGYNVGGDLLYFHTVFAGFRISP